MHGYVAKLKDGTFSEYVSWRDKSGDVTQAKFENVNFNKFGLTVEDEDDYYLNARYLNNVPLEQVWNQTENNPMLEVDSILGSLEDQLWNSEAKDDISVADQKGDIGQSNSIQEKTE